MTAKKPYKPERNGTGPKRPATRGNYRTHVLTNADAQRIVQGAEKENADEIMMDLFRRRDVSIKLKFESEKAYLVMVITPTDFTYGKSNTLIVVMRSLPYVLAAAAYMLDVLYPNFPEELSDSEEDGLAI